MVLVGFNAFAESAVRPIAVEQNFTFMSYNVENLFDTVNALRAKYKYDFSTQDDLKF